MSGRSKTCIAPDPAKQKGGRAAGVNGKNKGRKASASTRAKNSATTTLQRGVQNKVRPITDGIIQQLLLDRDPLTGQTYVKTFLENFLNEAKKDPNSKSGQSLALLVLGNNLIDRLDSQVEKLQAKDNEFNMYRIRRTLFAEQCQVFDDDKNHRILAILSRRAGKSELAARILAKATILPNLHVLYINRTFDNAVEQVGRPLQKLLDDLGIKPYKGSISNGFLEFQNGSYIKLTGCNNKGEVDKFRGDSNDIIVFDEAPHSRVSKQLIAEVLEPSMLQSRYNQLIAFGTPPRNKNNYVLELRDSPHWKKYFWTFLNNPFIPEENRSLEKVAQEYNTTVDDPFIQREYGGQFVFDINAEVFPYVTTFDTLPKGKVTHAYISVDWGFEDRFAVVGGVVIGRKLYVTDCYSEAHKGIQECSQLVKALYDKFKRTYNPVNDIVVITDTNDKQGQYDLSYVYHIPNVQNAYKYDKSMALRQLSFNLKNTNIQVQQYQEQLLEDLENCLWKRDERDNILSEVDEDNWHMDPGYALLYMSRHYTQDYGVNMNDYVENILPNYDPHIPTDFTTVEPPKVPSGEAVIEHDGFEEGEEWTVL